jgi:hypothetical protein
LKLFRVPFILLLVSAAFATTLYGLSTPDLSAQVTGTVSISMGSNTTSSTSITATVSSTLSTTSTTTSTLTTRRTTIFGGGGGDGGGSTTTTSTNIPELQTGSIVLASTVGLALLLCRRHRSFHDKGRNRASSTVEVVKVGVDTGSAKASLLTRDTR